MLHKFTGIYVTDTAASPTSPIELGADNCAMFEVWMVSKSDTTSTMSVYLDASNDGLNWSTTPLTAATVGTSAPAYKAVPYSQVIPYSQIRLRLTLSASSGAIADASVRTFRTT